jgi:hypothetical protein
MVFSRASLYSVDCLFDPFVLSSRLPSHALSNCWGNQCLMSYAIGPLILP